MDEYDYCMGDINFIFSKRGIYLERKYRNNGLFEITDLDISNHEEDEENLPPTPINLSPSRIETLDQYDSDESFFLRKIRSNFMVNKVFMASVSVRQVKENNVFCKYSFEVKKMNYWH